MIKASFSVLSDNSARVTWQPPSPPNGVITQYDIVVYNTRSDYRRTFTKRGDDTDLSVTLNDLSECVRIFEKLLNCTHTAHACMHRHAHACTHIQMHPHKHMHPHIHMPAHTQKNECSDTLQHISVSYASEPCKLYHVQYSVAHKIYRHLSYLLCRGV